VQVWYPAQASPNRATYGVATHGVKQWLYRHIVTTHAAPNAAFATGSFRAPTLIYIAAWGGERTDNTALAEDLASHGFVVAGLGDIAFDDPPAADLAGPADLSSQGAYEATVRLARRKLAYDVQRIEDILNRLAALDRHDPDGRFTGRLDVERAGVLGYSFGGAAAFAASRHDPRIRAALNMDGWLFNAADGYNGGFPYFLISDRSPLPTAADLTSADPNLRYSSILTVRDEKIQDAALAHGGYELQIAGADHLNFSDVPLYSLRHRGGVDPRAISRTVRAYTIAFFEHALEGKPSILLTTPRNDADLTFGRWPTAAEKDR
jgi:dienelactone hydrolase